MIIPNIDTYTGQKPSPEQPQPEFNQNMSDELDYFNALPEQLNLAIDAMNTTATQVTNDAASAAQSANAAEAAAGNNDYQGVWQSGASSALKGQTWQVNGAYYVALQDTSVDPVNDDVNWREVVTTSFTTKAQSQAIGGEVYKGTGDDGIQNGDTVPAGTVYVLHNSRLNLVSPPASGVISNLSDRAVTIGTEQCKLLKKVYSGEVVVDAQGLGGMVDDTQAFLDAFEYVSALQYVKRGVRVVARAPVNYYQISASIPLSELWNICFECEVRNAWNRSEFGDIETVGGAFHWIGNTTDSMFLFRGDIQGCEFINVVINGRETLKMGFDMASATPSVLRDLSFINCGSIYGDFGSVVGDISGTDIAPVRFVNPLFRKNKSAGLVCNSGNAQLTVNGGFITNNGFAPSTGNSFIPDADNLGFQMLSRAGRVWLEDGVILDGAAGELPASGESVRCAGGTMSISCWDDTPEVVSLRATGTCEGLNITELIHFDGDMTRANTPVSIVHDAPCSITFGGGVSVFGDIEVNSGKKAGAVPNGVNFLHPDAKFSGTGLLGLAGFNQDENSGDMTMIVGGTEIFPGGDTAPAKQSIHSRPNRPAVAHRSTSANAVLTTFTVKDNGHWEYLTNAWYDTGANSYKSIGSGAWSRKLVTPTGVEQLNSGIASAGNEVLTMSIAAGFRKGAGANGKYQLELSDNKFSFDIPTSGSVVRGDVFFRSSAVAGGKAADIVTVTGTVGVDAVIKPCATIDN